MKNLMLWLTLCVLTIGCTGDNTMRISVERLSEGAPLTVGIPFPKGELMSPDHVRLLDQRGREIPCQTTMVTSWEPLDPSVKWLWVFFFSTGEDSYELEYGDDVRKAPIEGDRIKFKNAQRTGQTSVVETGPLKFNISKRGGGFIDHVIFDAEQDGLGLNDTIAVADGVRGSFLDILDDLGVDSSHAIIHNTYREKGSGPLHTIIRIEGMYTYNREDNRESPFTIRIHLYAGKSYMRVFHTLTYTGVPDKHIRTEGGQHASIALEDYDIVLDDSNSDDEGWMEPDDRIIGTGLSLAYRLSGDVQFKTGYLEGEWTEDGVRRVFEAPLDTKSTASCFQTGPKPDRVPPVPNSSLNEQIDGFVGSIRVDGEMRYETARAEGWADISNERWGIGVGIRNFVEEYPKEIDFDMSQGRATAYLWSPEAGPLSLARSSLRRDQGMIANFAEGITKTSEVVFYFHRGAKSEEDLRATMGYFLDPPIPHADPSVYTDSQVYGDFSPRQSDHQGFERSLDYKLDWQLFNQHWEPWYGMLDYGDQKQYYFNGEWYNWINNEPNVDFMYWLQFMRTGDPKYYLAAEAMSRHTMDVDNVHWPTNPEYTGFTNESLDFWAHTRKEQTATPYLGIGRRHAGQHWSALLSAHVWVTGWVSSYYLTGYHRGLDIARLSADSYLRRIWGDHGLTGRRLYLSVWNLVEAWDATKDPRYLEELQHRVDIMLAFQHGPDQYDNLLIDRYGYSQVYASHGLFKYHQITGDERVAQALVRHARAIRDNPPYNHEYESYFSTIHPLLLGYKLTDEESFLSEARLRAESLKVDELSMTFDELGTQAEVKKALHEVSNLPEKGYFQTHRRRSTNWDPTHGLRVFGWTHMYSVPWLLYTLRQENIID